MIKARKCFQRFFHKFRMSIRKYQPYTLFNFTSKLNIFMVIIMIEMFNIQWAFKMRFCEYVSRNPFGNNTQCVNDSRERNLNRNIL